MAETRLDIKVHPGAGKNEVTGFRDGVLNIRVTAQPEKGKANAAVIKYLSKELGIAKGRVEIVKGTSSRTKTVVIEDMTLETIREKLEKLQ